MISIQFPALLDEALTASGSGINPLDSPALLLKFALVFESFPNDLIRGIKRQKAVDLDAGGFIARAAGCWMKNAYLLPLEGHELFALEYIRLKKTSNKSIHGNFFVNGRLNQMFVCFLKSGMVL